MLKHTDRRKMMFKYYDKFFLFVYFPHFSLFVVVFILIHNFKVAFCVNINSILARLISYACSWKMRTHANLKWLLANLTHTHLNIWGYDQKLLGIRMVSEFNDFDENLKLADIWLNYHLWRLRSHPFRGW